MNSRIAGVLLLLASLACAGYVRTEPPVMACTRSADGRYPADGPLEVLPSEVPGISLDSMQWRVRMSDRGWLLGKSTSLVLSGRIVATEAVSLSGVGVLFEGIRDSAVVYRKTVKRFYEERRDPVFDQVGHLIVLRLARPEHPVPVFVAEPV